MEEWLWYCVCFVRIVSRAQLRTLIKTHNFVTFYEFLSHLGMHHTYRKQWASARINHRLGNGGKCDGDGHQVANCL
jgi:hypothetical protein